MVGQVVDAQRRMVGREIPEPAYAKGFYTTLSRGRRIPCENQLNASPLSHSPPSGRHRLMIGLLILLGCLVMINTSSVVDTARDVYKAWQIAGFSNFALEGPYVGGVFHGGPVWFYLLSIPLFLTPSWVVMNLWVGLLTGMKYALAYACGARLGDRNFGLMWACLLALPDWTSVNYLIFSHTNLVQSTLLLCFYSLVRWQQGSDRWFLILCLALGLGVHAHPTVYAAGLLALPFVLKSLWRGELRGWLLPGGALFAVLPFIPYVISQQLQQWPDWQTGTQYFASQPLWINLFGFFDVMQGALLDGPRVALRQVLGLDGILLYLAYAVVGGILLGGLGLSFRAMVRHDDGGTGLYLLLATLVCIAAVALIRHVTPFYQTFVIYPPFYGLVAWGWCRAAGNSPWPRRLLFMVSLVSLSGFFIATLQMGRSGHLQIPQASMMDVRTHRTDEFADTIYYPGWGRRVLGQFICNAERPLTFHGFASLVLEQSYALEARMRCGAEAVFMGGKGAGRHYLGISHRDIGQLGIEPGLSLGSMGLFEVDQVIAPDQRVQVPAGDVYPPRPIFRNQPVSSVLQFRAAAQEVLAITNLYHYWMPYSFVVSLNGRSVEPSFRSMVNAYYECGGCAPDAVQEWSVTIAAPSPDLVEVVTFTPERRMQ